MRALIRPGATISGEASVPGDKSIAHRWLIFAATAKGESVLGGLPPGQDVASTARCMAVLSGLEPLRSAAAEDEGQSPTWNELPPWNYNHEVRVQAEGRERLRSPAEALDCGNSGTTIRLLMGLLSGCPIEVSLSGDESLRRRPMERIAEPLRSMGAQISTTDGHAPVQVHGGALSGITYATPVPSAQLKSALLLAGLAAEGTTTVVEPVATRDHTERLLGALGAPVRIEGTAVSVEAFQHAGFTGRVPGDPSSAAYLLAAAALTGGALTIRGVGLNPSRTHFLGVLERMGVAIEATPTGDEVGEPVGEVSVGASRASIAATTVSTDELPLVIDEVPILAALAAHADGTTRFEGAGELRVKESDRLQGTADGLVALGGRARVDGDDLVVDGGGLTGGNEASPADALGDHRLAMAFAVASLRASEPAAVDGMEWASITFPGFEQAPRAVGADLEVA